MTEHAARPYGNTCCYYTPARYLTDRWRAPMEADWNWGTVAPRMVA